MVAKSSRFTLCCFLIVVFALALEGPAARSEVRSPARVEEDSRVVEVTVFQDRASVRRRLSRRLTKGATTLVFRGVTPLADRESFRAFVSDRAHATLMGIRVEPEYSERSGNPELERWLDTKKKQDQRRQEILSQVALISQANQNLNALGRHYRDSFSLNLHQGSWSKGGFDAFLKLLAGQGEKFNAGWWKLFQDYQKVTDELSFTSAKISELSRVSDRKRLAVAVDLLVDQEAAVDIDIQYLVSGCGWDPSYDLRLDPREKSATLEQYAFVWQKTGETWKDVSLTLSNVRSELKPVPPSISPYTLSVREVKKVQTTIRSATDSVTGLTVGDAEGEGEGSGIARVFKVPGRQTVRDGLARTRVFIAAKSAPFEERYELVASRLPRVYRKVETKNPFSWDLEGGTASVYWNGDFLQQMRLENVAKGDRIGINAGVEADFLVSRWNSDKTAEPGILDSQRHHQREVNIDVRYFGTQSRKVRVYEPVPVSEIKEVVVQVKGSTDGLNEDRAHPGWSYWDLAVDSRESKRVTLKMDVAVPSSFGFSW